MRDVVGHHLENDRIAERRGGGARLGQPGDETLVGDGQTDLREQPLGIVFVDGGARARREHGGQPPGEARRGREGRRRHARARETIDGVETLARPADDGDTAIDLLKKDPYDILLLDIRMPRVNGVEVLKYLRERKIASRVIMLTAVDDLSVAIESVKNGANDYITKPYDLQVLLSSIQRVMAK